MSEFPEERIGKVCVLRVDQPIDRDHVGAIESWVRRRLEDGERFLVLHCARSLCFDSIGLETILQLTRDAAAAGARFVLAQLHQNLATTLRVTRLERAIEHYLTVEDAVRALRGRAT